MSNRNGTSATNKNSKAINGQLDVASSSTPAPGTHGVFTTVTNETANTLQDDFSFGTTTATTPAKTGNESVIPNKVFSFGKTTTITQFSTPTTTTASSPVFQFGGLASDDGDSDKVSNSNNKNRTRRHRTRKEQPTPEKRSSFLFLATDDAPVNQQSPLTSPSSSTLVSTATVRNSSDDIGTMTSAKNSDESDAEHRTHDEKKDPVAIKREVAASMLAACFDNTKTPSLSIDDEYKKPHCSSKTNCAAAKKEVTTSMLSKLAACFDPTEMMELLTGKDFPTEITLVELAASKDWMGHSPLHLAAYNCVGVEVVNLLLFVHPQAASQGDENHHTPLHLAFLGAASLAAAAKQKSVRDETRGSHNDDDGKDVGTAIKSSVESAGDGNRQANDEKGKDKQDEKSKIIICRDVSAALLEHMDASATTMTTQSLLHLAIVNHAYCEAGVLDLIVRFNPAAALQKNAGSGRTPLHVFLSQVAPSLSSSPSSEDISLLRLFLPNESDEGVVVDAKEVAKVIDYNGRTPLHTAAYSGVRPRILEVLLDIYPEASTQKDYDGCTPIQLALIGSLRRDSTALSDMDKNDIDRLLSSTHIILKTLLGHSTLYHSNGAPIVTETKNKQSLLHLAVALSCASNFLGLEIMETILRSNPSLNLHQDFRGRSPLHVFLSHNSSTRQRWVCHKARMDAHLELLLRKTTTTVMAPGKAEEPVVVTTTAASLKDRDGTSPLHIVTTTHGFGMKALLDACPAAARSKDCRGRVPLFFAFHSKLFSSSRKLLMEAYPDAVYEKDDEDRTALHLVLQNECTDFTDCFNRIFQANTDAAYQRDKDGLTPLMIALGAGSHSKKSLHYIVSSILKCCPLSEKEGTKRGEEQTTLHCAVEKNLSCEIVAMVLQSNPRAAGRRNLKLETPLSIAIRKGRGDLCNLLLESWPQAARTLLQNNTVALHHVISMDCLVPVIRSWPEAALHRASKDGEGRGRTPIHYWLTMTLSSTMNHLAAFQEMERCLGNVDPIKVADATGVTPLQATLEFLDAFQNGQHFAKILSSNKHIVALLRAYPDALFLPLSHSVTVGDGVDDNDEESSIQASGHTIVRRLCRVNFGLSAAFKAILEYLPKSPSSVSFLSVEDDKPSQPDDDNGGGGGDDGEESDEEKKSKDQRCGVAAKKVNKLSRSEEMQRAASHTREPDLVVPNQREEEEEEDMWTVRLVHELCAHSSVSGVCSALEMCHIQFPRCFQVPLENLFPLNVACRSPGCRLDVVQLLTTLYGSALHGGSSNAPSLGLPFVEACLCNTSLDVLYHLLQSAPEVLMNFCPRSV